MSPTGWSVINITDAGLVRVDHLTDIHKDSAMINTSHTTGTTDYRFTSTRAAQNATFLDGLRQVALSVVRIAVAFLFICHGAQKLFGAFGGIDGQGTTAPVGSWPTWWAGLIELVGGGLVLVGLFTMPAALLCCGAMAFAYFAMHQPLGLFPLQNKGEPAALYAWVFLLIAILGPGRFALDAVLPRLRPTRKLQE
jgi:putative oxidoreductase